MRQASYAVAQPIDVAHAVDQFIADGALNGWTPRTIDKYTRYMQTFLGGVPRYAVSTDLAVEDFKRHVARYVGKAASTHASQVSLMTAFSTWLHDKGYTETDLCKGQLKRPKRTPYEYLPVTTTSSEDVTRMIEACETMQELICLAVVALTGRRRVAVANARRRDLDLDRGTIKFSDKNRKVIEQPIPGDLLTVLRAADDDGVWSGPDAYLVPNRRPSTSSTTTRSHKVIYETVIKIAKRAKVSATVHSLRAAFAVRFLESNPGQIEACKELLGHDNIGTTMVYLRRMNRAAAMERVRDLSFGAVPCFQPEHGNPALGLKKAHTGFEPVIEASADEQSDQTEPVEPLTARLTDLRSRQSARRGKKAVTA